VLEASVSTSDAGQSLAQVILNLLRERGPEKSICPSDAARTWAAVEGHPAQWRQYMQPVRDAAAGLAAAGRLVVTQGSRTVDIATARGAIRLRLP
jgi:hypothetical protein